MKITLLSVVLAGALCAACTTTTTDPPAPNDGAGNVIDNGYTATVPQPEPSTDDTDSLKARSKGGNPHPIAPMAVEALNDTSMEPLRATGD